jgi:hypothetical protein
MPRLPHIPLPFDSALLTGPLPIGAMVWLLSGSPGYGLAAAAGMLLLMELIFVLMYFVAKLLHAPAIAERGFVSLWRETHGPHQSRSLG